MLITVISNSSDLGADSGYSRMLSFRHQQRDDPFVLVKRKIPNLQQLYSSSSLPLLSYCCTKLKSLWPENPYIQLSPCQCVSSSSFFISHKIVVSFIPTGRTHTSSTRTWTASSSYRLCCGPSSPASLSCQSAAAPRRWPHRTPPSDSFVSAPSTQCMSLRRFSLTAPWRLPRAPDSPSASQARSAL